ncbi:MAG: ABC transporter permease [Firmicutes bacterium]|nr:ABC transporter permease [Bacillota bacterium]
MGRYVAKRILQIIPIILVVSVLIFAIMSLVPSDPITIIMSQTSATAEEIEAARDAAGYNDPFLVRLGNYLKNLYLHGDMGKSFKTGSPVFKDLLTRLPVTFRLAFGSILVSVLLGIPLGVLSAVRAGTLTDRTTMFFTLMLNSMPNFWLALMLVILFSLKLKLLPSNGIGGIEYYILPVIANSVGAVAGIARQTRASVLEVIRSDFVSTARSKGLKERVVIWKHALPNGLIPVITSIGGFFGRLLGGSMVIEMTFSLPGVGSYMINGINNRDYDCVQGAMLWIAFIFAVTMLVVDLLYAFIDPRIKAQYAASSAKKKTKKEAA